MTVRFVLCSALMVIGSSTAGAQAPASPPAPAATVVLPCVQAHSAASRTVDAATARLEAARQTNSGPAMRAAVDDLDRLLRDLRAQLASCSAVIQAPQGAAIPKAATVIGDLKCGIAVDAKTAPRMLHQGQTYYFCNDDERAAFAREAAKAAPPPTSAPAHVH